MGQSIVDAPSHQIRSMKQASEVGVRGFLGLMIASGLLLSWGWGCSSSDVIANSAGGGSGGSGAGASSGSTSSSSSTGSGSSFIALPCLDDQQCDQGHGRCMRDTDTVPFFSEFFSSDSYGGPANGYCTADCAIDSDCPGDMSRCISTDTGGICILTCVFGSPILVTLTDPPPPDKCQGRDDLMCTPSSAGETLCLPVCGSDTECSGQRGCDLRAGLCVANPRQGYPLAAACIPDEPNTSEDEDKCAGECEPVANGAGQEVNMCSAPCSLGGDLDTTMNCGGRESGICAFVPSFTEVGSSALGDLGLCSGACEKHDQCNWQEGMFCFDIAHQLLTGKGYCGPAVDCSATTECDTGKVCAPTQAGSFCLELDGEGLLIPLGDAALPGSGGGGGGAGGAGSGGA